MTEWYQTFFDALAHDVWRGLVPDTHSDAEAACIASVLHLPTDRVPADQLTRLAGFDGHQGVLLEVEERRWADVEEILVHAAQAGHAPFVLVLEHLQDPTNFGTLLRSAEAAGVDGVVFPERGAAPLSPASCHHQAPSCDSSARSIASSAVFCRLSD